MNRSALVLDQSLFEYGRQRLRGKREFRRAAVMAEAVYLLFPRALLRSLFIAFLTRSLYRVCGKDKYGRS
jgi:hypothetical protein